MFTVIYYRYGRKEEVECETREEANRQFNYISEYEIGFPDVIVDPKGIVIRDGKRNVLGIKPENRVGKVYEQEV